MNMTTSTQKQDPVMAHITDEQIRQAVQVARTDEGMVRFSYASDGAIYMSGYRGFADECGHREGSVQSPAFTGLHSMYFATLAKCSSSRMRRSK